MLDLQLRPNLNLVGNNSVAISRPSLTKINIKELVAQAQEEALTAAYKPNTWLAKLMDYSKVVFPRESTYRGFVSIFADDLPTLLAEAFRGSKAFVEALFKEAATTAAVFVSPIITKIIAAAKAKGIFGDYGVENLSNLMLFSREDLETLENFDKAREKIVAHEIQDQMNLIKFHGVDSVKAKECIANAEKMQKFMGDYQATESLRQQLLKLKDETIITQSWVESAFWGGIPFLVRLFRKYGLGVDRFVGSINYLDDKSAEKLGNQKHFTFKQIFGTVLGIVLNPLLVGHVVKQPSSSEATSAKTSWLKEQLDTQHGFYPKLGLFVSFGELPYIISRLFNSQDVFELVENFVKFCTSSGSLLFGDRITNGWLAKKADKEFSLKHDLEPGTFYYREPQNPSSLWSTLCNSFPAAAKFQHVLNSIKHKPQLKQEASDIYQKTFYKGFGLHSLGAFAINTFINWTTRARVQRALKTVS